MVAKVYERVKYLQRKCVKERIEAVQEQDSHVAGRVEWNISCKGKVCVEPQKMWRSSGSQIGANLQKKPFILNAFRSQANLKSILEDLGECRCYEKVKTIFRYKGKNR